ncbi:MAG: SHOCT domain-containing protein [Desulfobulbaceae bacterium]|uniref:SHOCT domain-containing protein n=1 Tax=Candidatus Desulfobia pelagia TaxID=2841692 RepID=A0A8J6TBH0_9BACT|nr:SHOCT domain-containing protein [Candidatus Desulfobia pelagia]
MGPEYFWMSGMWIFPVIMLVVMLGVIYLIFGRGTFRGPWCGNDQNQGIVNGSESAMDILKKRYAKGEITKEEFEQIKRDIL